MKILNASIHSILDYATVIAFASAPTLLGFSGAPAVLAYLLAGVHLAMTVLTDMPLGLVKIIPMRLHALVEMLVGPTLLAVALLAPSLVMGAQGFFIASGIAICAVWFLSDYASATLSA
ncbi:MAG: hypothetical protein ACK5Q4_12075 [Phycisphaerae bacterium]